MKRLCLFAVLASAGCATNLKTDNATSSSGASSALERSNQATSSFTSASWCSPINNLSEYILFTVVILVVVAVIFFLKKQKSIKRVEAVVLAPKISPDSNASLTEAVATLARDLSIREKETQKLHDIIIRKEQRRVLARVCSIYETAEFTRRINAVNKIDDKEALNQLLMEIESALADLSLEILDINVGSLVKDLPQGSFTIVSAEASDTPTNSGRVKEIVSRAIYVKDGSGSLLFISPAKLKVYKL